MDFHSWPVTGPLPTTIVVADMTGSKCNAVGFPLQYACIYMNPGTIWNMQVVLGPAELAVSEE